MNKAEKDSRMSKHVLQIIVCCYVKCMANFEVANYQKLVKIYLTILCLCVSTFLEANYRSDENPFDIVFRMKEVVRLPLQN